MSVRNMGCSAMGGRIFVFICLNLYVTVVSGLPVPHDGDVNIAKDGGVSDSKSGESVYQVNLANKLDSLDQHADTAKSEHVIPSKNIQEVSITHGLNKVGKHTGYTYHSNSHNGKVKFDTQGFVADSKISNKVRPNGVGGEIALAQRESLTPKANDAGTDAPPANMVLTLASVLVGLFGMSVLVAIFQCCCKKKNNDDSIEERVVKDEKSEETRDDPKPQSVPQRSKDSDVDQRVSAKTEQSQDAREDREESVSFRNRIKAFEKTSTPEPTPVSKGPTPKKRPQSEAFKAFEKKGILIGMGRSPLLTRKAAGNEDENQNETRANISPIQEDIKSPDKGSSTGVRKAGEEGKERPTVPEIKVEGKEVEKQAEDDMAGYVQPENPDVVIADVDEDDTEFGAIKRETEVLRSYRKAPPPKNRNRSSAAFRRKAAKNSMADLINEDNEDSPLLGKTNTNLEVPKTDSPSGKSAEKSATPNSKDSKNNSSSAGAKTKEKSPRQSPEKVSQSPKKTPERENVKVSEPVLNVTDVSSVHSSSETSAHNSQDSKSEPEPAFPPGSNIFLQIDPTVRKKSPDVPKKTPLQHGSSQPDIRVGSGPRDDIGKPSPVLPDGRLTQALTDKLKGKNGDSELKQNKLYNRRSLNTDL